MTRIDQGLPPRPLPMLVPTGAPQGTDTATGGQGTAGGQDWLIDRVMRNVLGALTGKN